MHCEAAKSVLPDRYNGLVDRTYFMDPRNFTSTIAQEMVRNPEWCQAMLHVASCQDEPCQQRWEFAKWYLDMPVLCVALVEELERTHGVKLPGV